MNIVFKFIAISIALLLSLSSIAQTKIYSFTSFSSPSTFQFPGLLLDGEVNGELRLSFTQPGPFVPTPPSDLNIERLSMNFLDAPKLEASNFSFDSNLGAYVAELNSKWVFRKVKIEVLDINPFVVPGGFRYRISVVTNEDFIGSSLPGPFSLDTVLSEGTAELMDQTPFKLVDSISKVVDGKRLLLKLNGSLSSNIDPTVGAVGEGFEVKLLWFGRGEKVVYVPFPLQDMNRIKPVGLILDGTTSNNVTDYILRVRYEDNGSVQETFGEPLMFLLDQVFPPLP